MKQLYSTPDFDVTAYEIEDILTKSIVTVGADQGLGGITDEGKKWVNI